MFVYCTTRLPFTRSCLLLAGPLTFVSAVPPPSRHAHSPGSSPAPPSTRKPPDPSADSLPTLSGFRVTLCRSLTSTLRLLPHCVGGLWGEGGEPSLVAMWHGQQKRANTAPTERSHSCLDPARALGRRRRGQRLCEERRPAPSHVTHSRTSDYCPPPGKPWRLARGREKDRLYSTACLGRRELQ